MSQSPSRHPPDGYPPDASVDKNVCGKQFSDYDGKSKLRGWNIRRLRWVMERVPYARRDTHSEDFWNEWPSLLQIRIVTTGSNFNFTRKAHYCDIIISFTQDSFCAEDRAKTDET